MCEDLIHVAENSRKGFVNVCGVGETRQWKTGFVT